MTEEGEEGGWGGGRRGGGRMGRMGRREEGEEMEGGKDDDDDDVMMSDRMGRGHSTCLSEPSSFSNLAFSSSSLCFSIRALFSRTSSRSLLRTDPVDWRLCSLVPSVCGC